MHGLLLATLLAGLGGRRFVGCDARSFSFRALKPVFDVHPFDICGKPDGSDAAELWVRDFEGHRTMTARIELRA